MDYKKRQTELRSLLDSHHLEVLLVTHAPNVRYLCGFTGSAGALLVSEAGSMFFTDGRYTAQAREEVNAARVVIARKAPLLAVAEHLAKQKKRTKAVRIGIEAEHLTVAERSRLVRLLPLPLRLRDTSSLVEQLRMVKDADEVKLIRDAALSGARLFDRALEAIHPGIKETEVAGVMEYAARVAGTEEMSFPTIIASGRRSALPHGRASTAEIPRSGFVVCDFGVILAGYCSDRTRTVHVGRPEGREREVYDTVREAQQAGIEAVRPDIAVEEVDRAARRVLKERGLAKYFTHSTGHGVGLEIHEMPRVAAGQHEVLRPGMVITIEPGVYIPGHLGVRIEDMVLVTEHGREVLAPGSTELVTI